MQAVNFELRTDGHGMVHAKDTRDMVEPEVNRYRRGKVSTHKNHLHVTAVDAYLTP